MFAVALSVATTVAATSASQDISLKSKEVNTAIVQGASWFPPPFTPPSQFTHMFNVTMTAVYPRAIIEGTYYIEAKLLFVIMLPENVTSYLLSSAEVIFGAIPEAWIGIQYWISPLQVFNGTHEGVALAPLNLSIFVSVPQTFDIPQDTWLYVTRLIKKCPMVYLAGQGDMVLANGSQEAYSLYTEFNATGYPMTVYRFGYPPVAWIAYSSSAFIGAVSVFLLVRTSAGELARKRLQHRRLPSTSTSKWFLKKCVKCRRDIPIASEECKYCGARQPDRK